MNPSFLVLFIILVIIVLLGIIFLILDVVGYYDDRRDEQLIKFEDFLNLYTIAKDKWDIDYSYCVIYENGRCRNRIYMRTYLDYLRYRKWRKNIFRQEVNQKLSEEQLELIKKWQKDIDEYYKKCSEDLHGKLDDI